MKKIIYLSILLFFPFIIIGCNNNDDYKTQYLSVGTVDSDVRDDFLFRLDDGDLVRPLNFGSDAENGKRILMTYTREKEYDEGQELDYDIKLTGFTWILTKDIIDLTNENKDEIGDDTFNGIRSIYIGGDCINIAFYFRAYSKVHLINLVENKTLEGSEESSSKINLEFRHNAYDDGGYIYLGLASFPIKKYIDNAQGDIDFSIRVKIDGEDMDYKLTYSKDMSGKTQMSERVLEEVKIFRVK